MADTNGRNVLLQFVDNGTIKIDHEEWKSIRAEYSNEQITDWLVEAIIGGKIGLPLRTITHDDMVSSFEELVEYRCRDYQTGDVFTRYDYSYGGLDKYINETNVGHLASDYFHQASRYMTGSVNSPSPVRTWENEKFLRGALKALFSLKCDRLDDNALRLCLAMRKYVASQFKPSVAKSVYEKFGSQYVLDFSSGWGDRLCGFFAASKAKHYIGIDPNTALSNGYKSQIKEYSSVIAGKSAEMVCAPAEEADVERESVDTVFTSPPYFNVERYSSEDTQSYRRYRSIEKWLNGFLFPSLDTAYRALQKGGHMIINISDVYSGHTVNHICDPMNDHIASLGGEYEGCIGMKMSKRPNSKSDKNGVFVEPMWVWRKP